MRAPLLSVFLDGPLAGEIKEMEPVPTFRVALPPRATECNCNPWGEPEMICESPAEEFEYHRIACGAEVAFYSKHPGGRDALRGSLEAWVTTVGKVDRIIFHCRDLRAFS